MATLMTPSVVPQPRDDAKHLHHALKGIGCDKSTVISILAHRNAFQRALIEKEYKKMYSEDLRERLSSELKGNIKKAVLLWMPDPAQRDAIIVRKAFTTNIDVKAATEVLCSRTSAQIQCLKTLYHKFYGVFLEHDIISHCSGDHEKLLLAYINITRSEGKEFDKVTAINDAKALYDAGEKKAFIITFTGRSRAQLAAVSSQYHHMYGKTLEKAILSQTSGNFEHALVTILECAENPARYFAKVLHKTKKVMGANDDKTLIRVIVSRAEIDMHYIKEEYNKENKKSLIDFVRSMTSDHCDIFLVSLLGTVC